jgi:uncharacterized coiled-coil protein SlyX
MGIEIIAGIVSALLAFFAGALKPLIDKTLHPKAEKYYLENPDSKWSKFLSEIFLFDINKNKSFKERLSESLDTLKNATGEIDNVIEEISKISAEKHQTIEKLELQLGELETKETELRDKITTMEQVPVESIKHFEEILNKGNKRSAKRDYVIFTLGVILTTIIAIILNIFL